MEIEKDVLAAINHFISDEVRVMKREFDESKAILVAVHCGTDWNEYEDGQYHALNKIKTYDLMVYLVVHYKQTETVSELQH